MYIVHFGWIHKARSMHLTCRLNFNFLYYTKIVNTLACLFRNFTKSGYAISANVIFFIFFISFFLLRVGKNPSTTHALQVNLCQKLLFLHQLTHNTTVDCSLNYKFNTFWLLISGDNVLCTEIVLWHSEQFLYTTCSPYVVQKEELLTKIYLYVL